ncbi:MAG TPA: N-acetyltransferase [Longimicrobium sp.]|nr:N-acetyltransferase [Longimicrobium sp.]
MPPILVREEQPGDVAAIAEINRQAFGGNTEADLVDLLRQSCPERVSLVAVLGKEVVGHILFTPTIADAGKDSIEGMGLAPMAVLPQHQRAGVGSAMVRRGLEVVRAAGYPYVIVLGHPGYYPQFGFEPASTHGLTCEFSGIPDEAFMILALDPEVVKTMSGVVRYRPEFASAAEHG